MRTLTDTQLTAQKSRSSNPLAKIVLTYTGGTTYTFTFSKTYVAGTSIILSSSHSERQWSSGAQITLDDRSLALTAINLEGYKAVLSYGFTTSNGDEYSATAPLWVIGQQRDSLQGKVICSLTLEGIFDRLGKDKASAAYSQTSSDTNTVKTLITAIAGATLAPYTHCKAWTVTYDSQDSLIDSFIPADFFRVGKDDTRLAKIQELLAYTTCKIRPEADGNLHVFVPTTSGTTYAYEYSLADTYHTFLSKRFRRRVVSPNYIIVSSFPDQSPSYTGSATDASASLTGMEERETHYIRATSNAQCTSLAAAILSRYQLQDEKGAGILPIMNIGTEVYDYNLITDARAADTAVGNVGYITRKIGRNKFGMDFGFGRESLIRLETHAAIATGEVTGGSVAYTVLNNIIVAIYDNFDKIISILKQDTKVTQYLSETTPESLDDLADGVSYQRLLATQISAGKIYLSDTAVYLAGYNPSTKKRVFIATPTTPYDLGDLWSDGIVVKRCTTARASGAYVAGDWTQLTIDEMADGSTYAKLRATQISGGNINLTSASTETGKWYNKSGVVLDADYGIGLYGGQIALRTFPTEADLIAGTNLQCYVGTDGKIYAGGGNIWLSVSELGIKGAALKLYTGATNVGVIDGNALGLFITGAGNYDVQITPGGTGVCLIVALETVQSIVTGSRALDTVYQNTTGQPLLVTISINVGTSDFISVFVELGDTTPDTAVADILNGVGLGVVIDIPISFIVPNLAYYKVAKTGSPTIDLWTEWRIGA